MRELRIGLVGCGFMGSLHAATLAQSAGATLAAVFDTSEGAARSVAQTHSTAVAGSLEVLVREHDLDGVVVATPDALHLLSLIHISEPTRRTPISYAVF